MRTANVTLPFGSLKKKKNTWWRKQTTPILHGSKLRASLAAHQAFFLKQQHFWLSIIKTYIFDWVCAAISNIAHSHHLFFDWHQCSWGIDHFQLKQSKNKLKIINVLNTDVLIHNPQLGWTLRSGKNHYLGVFKWGPYWVQERTKKEEVHNKGVVIWGGIVAAVEMQHYKLPSFYDKCGKTPLNLQHSLLVVVRGHSHCVFAYIQGIIHDTVKEGTPMDTVTVLRWTHRGEKSRYSPIRTMFAWFSERIRFRCWVLQLILIYANSAELQY